MPRAPSVPVEIPSVPVERQIRSMRDSMDRGQVPRGQQTIANSQLADRSALNASPLAVPQGLQGYMLAAHRPTAPELTAPTPTPQSLPVSSTMRKQLLERFDLDHLISTLPAAPHPPLLSPEIELDRSSKGARDVGKTVAQLAPMPGFLDS